MTWGRVVLVSGSEHKRLRLWVGVIAAVVVAVACQGANARSSSTGHSSRTTAPTQAALLPPGFDPPAGATVQVQAPIAIHRRIVGNRAFRILVVGDSVGASFATGMQLWAGANRNVRVVNDARSWCALGRDALISQGFSAGKPPDAGCSGWATRWSDSIRSFDPDVVFVLYSIWEISPRQLPGRTDWLQPGAAPLDAWQLSEYQKAADVLSARGAPIVWFTIPCENEPIAVGSPFWNVNRRTIPALAASRSAVHVVDLDHQLCKDGPSNDYAGVHDARPDGAHFSPAGALAVSQWVMPIVFGDAPNPQTRIEGRTANPGAFIRTTS